MTFNELFIWEKTLGHESLQDDVRKSERGPFANPCGGGSLLNLLNLQTLGRMEFYLGNSISQANMWGWSLTKSSMWIYRTWGSHQKKCGLNFQSYGPMTSPERGLHQQTMDLILRDQKQQQKLHVLKFCNIHHITGDWIYIYIYICSNLWGFPEIGVLCPQIIHLNRIFR